jgi:Flp pilus assembly secretin CpaC
MVLLLSNRGAANLRAIAAFCCFAILATSLPAGADGPGQILSIATGHSLILHGHGISKVAIGDGRIAAAVPLDSSKVLVNPKTAGDTTIFLWDLDGQHTYELTVTDARLDHVVGLLRTAIDAPGVTVSAYGSTIFVNGKVADVAEYARVDAAIERFKAIKFDGTTTNVVNGLEVRQPFGALQSELARMPGATGLRLDMDPSGNIVVSGHVSDKQHAQDVLDRVNGLAGTYLKTDGKVVDRLALDAKSQIDIKVDVLEVDKTAQSQLGLRLQTANETTLGNGQFTLSSSTSITAVENAQKATGANPFTVGPFARVSLLAPTLDTLIESGHARTLSSPNLVTTPGKLATFLVGGEVPIPLSNGLGTVTVDYKQYGVQLNVTPTIEADGSIDSVITPEISDLDFADGISLNGFTVPALKVSKIATDVTTQAGESIVLGGLLRRVESKNIQKIPLLGQLPILGPLFSSTSYQKTDTDVIFVLTPTIVKSRPVQVAEIAPTPGPTRPPAPVRMSTPVPTSPPTPTPTAPPTPTPTAPPTPTPTAPPTPEPTAPPTATPTLPPTPEPTAPPTATPTAPPTPEPTAPPTLPPTPEPTLAPTPAPAPVPTPAPPPVPVPTTAPSPAAMLPSAPAPQANAAPLAARRIAATTVLCYADRQGYNPKTNGWLVGPPGCVHKSSGVKSVEATAQAVPSPAP